MFEIILLPLLSLLCCLLCCMCSSCIWFMYDDISGSSTTSCATTFKSCMTSASTDAAKVACANTESSCL